MWSPRVHSNWAKLSHTIWVFHRCSLSSWPCLSTNLFRKRFSSFRSTQRHSVIGMSRKFPSFAHLAHFVYLCGVLIQSSPHKAQLPRWPQISFALNHEKEKLETCFGVVTNKYLSVYWIINCLTPLLIPVASTKGMKNFFQSSSKQKIRVNNVSLLGIPFARDSAWQKSLTFSSWKSAKNLEVLDSQASFPFTWRSQAIERWTFSMDSATRRSTSRVDSKAMIIATINPEAGNPWNFFKAFAAQIERCWVGVDSELWCETVYVHAAVIR